MPDPLEPGVCVADPRIAAQTHGNPHVSAGISVDPQGRQRPLTVPKTAPYAVTSAAVGYFIEGFATCKAGGRPGETWGLYRNVRAHEPLRTTSLGLFVLTPSCASSEGFEVTYLNQHAPSAGAPHESVILGTVTLSKATLPNGYNPKPPAG